VSGPPGDDGGGPRLEAATTPNSTDAIVPATPDEARAIVDRIKASVGAIHQDIVDLWEGQGWLALGYSSWDDLCDVEFAVRLALPREQRRELVADLTEKGMTTRAIAPAVGVDQSTVARQVMQMHHLTKDGSPEAADGATSAVKPSSEPPQTVTGLDGKTYPAKRKTRGRRTDVKGVMGTVLVKTRDAADAANKIKPEYLASRPDEAAIWARNLAESLEPLQRLLTLLEKAAQ
jgi:transposase-like protein